jgi:hypothetical protein
MIKNSHEKGKAVLMYQYKANPVDDDDDGILPPFSGTDGIQGKDYIIQTAVRSLVATAGSNDDIKDELQVVDGAVFVVRMTQLIRDGASSDLIIGDASKILVPAPDPSDDDIEITDPDDYTKAVIAFRAEFFKLSANKLGFINSDNWDFDKVGNALTEVNMAIRR